MRQPQDFKFNVNTKKHQSKSLGSIHKPYPHQKEAVKRILETFKTHDRAHVIMACGTGKTHVCLWVAEKLKAKRICVFVPSLALISQILHEWLDNTRWTDVSYMAVCSDETVIKGLDVVRLNPKECDFPVTTNAVEVYHSIKNKNTDVQLVFCTYHSSDVLAVAMRGNEPFDLCIFDEAHKTTGAYDRTFSSGLSNQNIPAKKRLFVTATPKHYDIKRKDRGGDPTLLYSMDSEIYYGPRAYTLTFRQAINLGIISDYKVVVPIIVKDNVRGRNKILGNEMDERAIALQKAVRKYDISKIISFHPSIKEAGAFSYYLNHIRLPRGFKSYHVNSTMTVESRSAAMSQFKKEKNSLVTNARCLTEGTNIPAVDMVVFFQHKRSKIDIVQAMGRAIRRHDNKDIGYIFIPLYVQQTKNEKIEHAVHRCHFDHLWDVLQALKEQDEDLAQTIQYLSRGQGEGKEFDLKLLNNFIDILPDDTIDGTLQKQLRQAITIEAVKYLGSSWDERYGELCAFKKKHGHCNVPHNYVNKKLAIWVNTQRNFYKRGLLSPSRIEELEKIRFTWNIIKSAWLRSFNQLCEFKKNHGHCNVPYKYINRKLAAWVNTQRNRYKAGKLSRIKIKQLKKIGFEWSFLNSNWLQHFDQLREFKRNYGHCNVPKKYSNKKLSIWVGCQRQKYKNKQLSCSKIQVLEKLGFIWNCVENNWFQNFNEMLAFMKIHGHHNIPNEPNNKKLVRWINKQRTKYNNKQLSHTKTQILTGIGFKWNSYESSWVQNFNLLLEFKNTHGHCMVPSSFTNKKLLHWIQSQRRLYQKKQLSRFKIQELEKMGFVWDPLESNWIRIFDQLLEFKKKYGHCNVSKGSSNKKLKTWVVFQRRLYKKKKLSRSKIKILTEMGFVWDPLESNWLQNFNRLLKFKKAHGDCNVPQKSENQNLGRWVQTQRNNYKKKQLSESKIQALEKIGFAWASNKNRWLQKFNLLLAFKENYGQCRVPKKFVNKQLANWVDVQRTRYKDRKLQESRIKALNKIGFVWNTRNND